MTTRSNHTQLIAAGHSRTRLIAAALFLLLLSPVTAMIGCKKLVTAPVPDNQLVSSSIFLDSLTAQSAVNGMYSQFYNGGATGASYYSDYITTEPSRMADEMYSVQNALDPFATNTVVSSNTDVNTFWNNSYNIIYIANSIIAGLQASTTLTASLTQQLTGEAKFMRALCYFYLVNYFGDVPLELTTSINTNSSLARTASASVYSQMVSDLSAAESSLATDYSWSQGNRTRANIWAAGALLARVYLYTGQWADAEAEATKVINATSLFSLVPDLNKAFLKNSAETIFALYDNVFGYTYLAGNTIPNGMALPLYAMDSLLSGAFEPGDGRLAKWTNTVIVSGVTYRYPFKYKNVTNTGSEYEIVLRLGEQYLIRAEARAQQNNISGAQSDLNVIRSRAGLAGTTASDQASLMTAVGHERQVELFYEWGHRWLDLKRMGLSATVLGVEKTGWKATDTLLPVPLTAISTNPALTQNLGY